MYYTYFFYSAEAYFVFLVDYFPFSLIFLANDKYLVYLVLGEVLSR